VTQSGVVWGGLVGVRYLGWMSSLDDELTGLRISQLFSLSASASSSWIIIIITGDPVRGPLPGVGRRVMLRPAWGISRSVWCLEEYEKVAEFVGTRDAESVKKHLRGHRAKEKKLMKELQKQRYQRMFQAGPSTG
jgi:hypothetical protein